MRYILVVFVLMFTGTLTNAQEKWDLRKIVDYAMANNITVKQADVQAQITELTYKQSKSALLPNASFGGNGSYNSGRNQDPTSFNLITQSYVSAALQLQTSVDIFNWYSKKNNMLANQWEAQAAKANTDKLRNDIALTAANSYLQILLSKEQVNIAEIQLKQTQAQLSNTRKLVNAGSLPELNASELEAQEARDSANLITANGNVTQAILVLKSNLNFDAAAPFEVAVPPVEQIPVENIADLQPDAVYALALVNMPLQKVNALRLKAAEKFKASAKGSMYPTISAFGSLGSGYNSRAQEIIGFTTITAPLGNVNVNGVDYNVFPNTPFVNYNYKNTALFRQFDQNFRQSVGLSLNIPILNARQLRTNYDKSKLNIRNLELQQEADNQKTKQDIYQAYNSALVAMEKFNASKKNVLASEKTLEFATKRYNVGMLSTFELITNQNNVFTARLEYVSNQYDFVFKMKVLEFYKGQGLKL